MKKYFFIFITCFIIYIIHFVVSGHGIYGDGNGYYSYTNAIFFEKSLNFGPIFNHLENFQGPKYVFSRVFWNASLGPLGIYKNPFPIGTGLFWIPSLAIIYTFVQDKFSLLLEIGPGITGILFAIGGIYFTQKYLENFYDKTTSVFAVLLFFVCSNLFYYSSFEPALSHQPAFFIVSLLLFASHKLKDKFLNFFLMGGLTGLLMITRVADVVLAIPALINLTKVKPKWDHAVMLPVGFIIFSAPLFASYYLMYGGVFTSPYITGASGTFNFTFEQIFEFFLSPKRGLFVWTPVYLLGLLGLIKTKKYIFILTVSILFLICSFWSANTSAGYGQRFAISASPFFIFGISEIMKNYRKNIIYVTFSLLFAWNMLTLFHFYYDSKNLIKNENLTMKNFVVGQFTSPVDAIKTVTDNGFVFFIKNKILD